MSVALVLKFQYKGVDVDVVVDDTDKVNLVDLVIEYWDKAVESKKPIPKHASFSYIHKMKHVYLNNDKDLMQMLTNLSGKDLIYIWVGEANSPSELLKAARTLRASRVAAELKSTVGQLGQTECDPEKGIHRRSLRNIEASSSKPDSDKQELKKLTPRRTPLCNVTDPVEVIPDPNLDPLIEGQTVEDEDEDIRANNDIPGKALNQLLWQRYGVQMVSSSLYRMRSKALREINGGHDMSYAQLPDYCEMIRFTNPGSSAFCAWTPQDHIDRPLQFLNIFISFKGCVDGLLAGCRSFIGVDGAHLKGNYGGVLLSAVALDANNELFPFAWAIVSAEDTDNWKFFVWHLKNLLNESGRGDEWCIISDRQKGIEAALTELWPKAGRRYCCKHLVKNWKKPFPGPLMFSLFWLAAGAYSAFTFKKAMDQLQKVNPAALIWLSKVGDQSTWTIHKFNEAIKCDVNKSNFVESFNSTLGMDRARPVLTLLEGIRRTTMVRMCTRKQASENWDDADICPRIKARLKVVTQESRACRAYPSADGYEVTDGKSVLPVSFAERRCLCGRWQISGIPCRHAIRAILHARLDPKDFVHEWYSVRRYKAAYAGGIKAIPDSDQWPDFDMPKIQAPTMKRGVGRPCRERRRDEDEERKGKRSKTIKCSNCGSYGHNLLTCKGGPTAKQAAAAAASKRGKGKQAGVAAGSGQAQDKAPAGAPAPAKSKGKGPTTKDKGKAAMSYSQPAPKMRKLSGIKFSTQPDMGS